MRAFISKLLIIVFGLLRPAFSSFKALRSPQEDDDRKWLTYWIIYACFASVEFVADVLIKWFPFYFEMKLIVLLWLSLEKFNGSIVIFEKYVSPWLMQNEENIEAKIQNSSRVAYKYFLIVFKKIIHEMSTLPIANGALKNVQNKGKSE
eukprot:TRINITY_DN1573_c0_g1_i2.p2 TRINITY_DN1573_c0_g1~~TRINITY_DN1573_c0_g1_i2.p2  ORF type:complete len:149 (-),score=30.58 TRINITY_DN1573_c0_g1_i2:1054-1500(-)